MNQLKVWLKVQNILLKDCEKGARSLIGNVVGGSFDSVTKITGSLYGLMKVAGGDT